MSPTLASGWYAVAESGEVKKRPRAFRRFSLDLVFWRDSQGRAAAAVDFCPHRSVRLSLGEVKGDRIQCPFHGMEFDRHGECGLIPETGKPAAGLGTRAFPLVEDHGFLWCWYPLGGPPSGEIPWFQEIPPGLGFATIKEQVQTHVTRAIENQLDYAHLPFVHKATIGRGLPVRVEARFQLEEERIKFLVGKDRGPETPFIDYFLPNIWMNRISPRFMIVLAFCPLGEDATEIYLRTYQSFLPTVIPNILSGIMNRKIFREDARVIRTHPSGASFETGTREKLIGSDRAIRHFRQVWTKRIPHME